MKLYKFVGFIDLVKKKITYFLIIQLLLFLYLK